MDKNIIYNVSPKEASEIIGTSPQFIRVGLQQGRLPFGTAVQMSSEWSYHISMKLLKEYIGKERVEQYYEKKKIKLV